AYLSGADLENYLRSLPSSALDQIEIMTNPPAKYDAAGNAGVINIKTKKSKVKGFNAGINASLNQGQLSRSNNSFNFNYRNNNNQRSNSISY
ncbi:MAG: TonB-dependent receptor, partial [Chryseobacterium sp.]